MGWTSCHATFGCSWAWALGSWCFGWSLSTSLSMTHLTYLPGLWVKFAPLLVKLRPTMPLIAGRDRRTHRQISLGLARNPCRASACCSSCSGNCWTNSSQLPGHEAWHLHRDHGMLLEVINTSIPFLYLVMVTPNWSCWQSHPQSIATATLWVRRFLLWICFAGIYLLWGAHMTCHPKDVAKADDGGWLFVVAKACAATFYLDVPLLFLCLFDGAITHTLSIMGVYIAKNEAVDIHRVVAKRLVLMASVHSVAHIGWISKDGLQSYSQKIWHNDFLPQLPFWTGVLMWLSVLITVPAYWLKKSHYDWFRSIKRGASGLLVFFGLFHGDAGALGSPTLWGFSLLVIIYCVCDLGSLSLH